MNNDSHIQSMFERRKENHRKDFNSRTLSLHIDSHEILTEASKEFSEEEGLKREKNGLSKWKKPTQFFTDFASVTQNPFEFPRQQNRQSIEPEIVQFKTSQRLLNPNKSNLLNENLQHSHEVEPSTNVSSDGGGSNSTNKCLLQIKKVKEFEELAKSSIKPGIINYNILRVLNRCYDSEDEVVEDYQLVEQALGNHLQYTMQCIELKDELAITNTLREIHILQHFGIHKYLMSLYTVFRHRQYIAMVFPAFLPIRNHLDVRYRFKNEGGIAGTGEARFNEVIFDTDTPFTQTWREENYLKTIGLFDRDAVSHVIKKVVKGLEYIHSKGYAHTEVCGDNVYIDLKAQVKIGGFLHCKKLDSKSLKFTGDSNCLPPECLDETVKKGSVDKSIDYWSLGLLTLEIITGKRHYLKEKKSRRLAREYLDGIRPLPTLGETDPKTLKNGAQAYHPMIDNFLSRLIALNPENRMSSCEEVLLHPFISAPVDKQEILRQWKITSDHFSACDGTRSLYHDMYAAQGSNPDVNEEFLLNIIQAIQNVEKDDYPLFTKVPEAQLCKNYIGIEASVAIPSDDANWSRDVLDISQRNVYEDEDTKEYNSQFHERADEQDSDDEWDDMADARRRKRQVPKDEDHLKSGHPSLDKDYQRFEICFFVKKTWSAKERQTFIAMQFGRWYQRGVIHFVDLIRVVDEIEEVFQNYVFTQMTKIEISRHLPEAVYFASPRRDIRFHPEFMEDRASRYLQHIYVDVAVHDSTNQTKLRKFEELMEGDPIKIPEGLATYQASVCFQDVDPQQFEELEAHMLGEIKCDGWEVSDSQRQLDATKPETKIYKLLYERRRNWFNHRNDSSNPGQASNQARCEKIWGDFRRDYIFRFCTWADLPHQVDRPDAKKLWGDPFLDKKGMDEAIRTQEISEEDLLEKQLARTMIKQEKDVVEQFKRVEDVDLRQKALEQYKQDFQGQEGYHKLENQLSRGKGATTKQFNPLTTPASHGPRKILRRY